jgi:hypothetical protein
MLALKAIWSSVSLREKLLVLLAIAGVLFAVFKKPETKVTTITHTKTVTVDRWHEQKLAKDWMVLQGLPGSTLKLHQDGTYEVTGPYVLSTTRIVESSSEHTSSSTTTTDSHTVTEPVVAWRLLIKGSVLTPINKLQPGWSLGIAAHVGKVSLLGLKFDVGAGGEVIRIGSDTFVGPQLLATF